MSRAHAHRHANRGVERNKKPLQNLCYRIKQAEREGEVLYSLSWGYERDLNRGDSWNFHGAISEAEIKALLSPAQWSKFRQGARQFVVQRRVDGRNVPKKPQVASSEAQVASSDAQVASSEVKSS